MALFAILVQLLFPIHGEIKWGNFTILNKEIWIVVPIQLQKSMILVDENIFEIINYSFAVLVLLAVFW